MEHPLQVTLGDEQANQLRKALYESLSEAIENVRQDARFDKDIYTIKQIATYLDLSPNTVRKYITLGLPVMLVDNRQYFSKQRVREWFLAHEVGGTSE